MRYFALTVFLVCSFTATGCMTSPVFVGAEKTPIQAPSAPPEPVEEGLLSLVFMYHRRRRHIVPMNQFLSGWSLRPAHSTCLFPMPPLRAKGCFPHWSSPTKTGVAVDPESPVAYGSEMKELVRDGKKVECVKGVRLLSGTGRMVVIEDIRNHYALTSGRLHPTGFTRFEHLQRNGDRRIDTDS